MKTHILALTWILAIACNSANKPGNSPYFNAEDILTISGKFLTETGKGLQNRNIALRNIRRFPYYDATATYVKDAVSWLSTVAFPMFPVYEGAYQTQKVKTNYFLKEVKTATDGSFAFQMRGSDVLRDAQGGINIVLINDGEGSADSYAKFSFVVKGKTTELGSIQQCSLGEATVESADSLSWAWSLPAFTLDHYEFRFADAQDNSLLWISHVDAAATSLSLPKSLFSSTKLRYAVEIFYTFSDELQSSCLTPSQTVSIATPKIDLAIGKVAEAENIPFQITSLTNGRFNDSSYFAAYDSREVTIDLGGDQTVSSVHLHNLQFTTDGAEKMLIEGAKASTPTQFESIGLDAVDALRFASYSLPTPGSWAKIRVSSPGIISTLQEITVQ